MKSFRIITLLAFVMLAFAISASAQVNVNPGAGSYTTLKGAFDAINAGTHTGVITFDIVGDTTETAPAVLNASGSGAASYTSIIISPSGGAARTISGAIVGGSPLIDFNGADNVTIDGLNTGGNSLTISNTTVSATTVTSTIRFIGGATGNTITNSNLQGSVSSSVATNGAVVFFSTDAVTANGNDNNTISNNNIGPAGANLPTKGILCNGSTTTTAIGNSGNIVNNNNIFDYFGAAVTSSGVAANGGCNAWSITNNRFYQTGTRTWTTGATHRAIDIGNTSATSGAQGFTITGNTVGYASNTQTGTYTLTGSTGKFQGIVFNGITGGTLSNINNNTVAAVSLTGVTSSGTSTSSPFLGMMVINGVADTNNNTIGNQAAINSLVFSTNTTTATDVYGIFNFSVNNWTSNNNNIGGIQVTNAGASGTFLVFGMRANTGTSVTWSAADNVIGGPLGNTIALNATGVASQVVGMQTPNAISTLLRNRIRNLSSNIGTGTTTAASVAGIIFTSTTPIQTVGQNIITGLTNTNATAASVVTGIQFTGGIGNVVERNLIADFFVATNSATAEVNGIRMSGGTTTYRNNMINLGAGIPNALGAVASNSSTNGINGFNGFLGTDTFIHNSIYIGGAPAAGAGASYALNGTQTINTRSFRNNIFFNGRTNAGATGSNYAVKINGTAPNPTGLTINNNVYFVNGTGGVFGFFNSLDVANLAAWKVAVGQDAGSFESNPQFVSTTDLHIHPTNATVVEGNGVELGVVNDIDDQTRSGLTPVDIGADAGNFTSAGDILPPAITYGTLGNTSSTGDRVLNTTITDASGVPTAGVGLPVIYYRKNMGGWASTQCSLISGNNYDCTIVAVAVGGVVVTDVIQYYVAAQDTVGNVSVNPSGGAGGFTTNPPAASTPPTTPNQYTIVGAATGSYNVGTGETYTSLTNTGGIFEFINNSEVTGNITINITTDLTGELGTVALNEFASPFTILIKPSGAPRTITGTNTGALIRLNGADRVRFDGSTAAMFADNVIGGNPALREMTIQNTNVGTSAVVMSVASNATNGAQNNTIRNINILGQDPTTTLLGISLGGATPGTIATGPNNGNRVENCSVKRAIFGIYSAGRVAPDQNTGTVITMNEISGVTAERIRRVGIVVFNENGVQITENSIEAVSTNESADAIGIAVGNQGIDTSNTSSGGVINALVERNKINGVASLSTTGFSAAGITVAGGTGGANTVRNNMITGVTAPATSPDIVAGIYVVGATGSSTRLYHNSVAMSGDRGSVASQMPSYGVAVTGTDPTVEMKNNIFFTNQFASGGGVNAVSYAIGMVTTAFANLDSNYNDFYSVSGTAFRSGSLGAAAGTSYATLALWQAAVADDANSQEVDPMFNVVASDLHLIATTSPLLGDGITGFATVDFDNDPRPASNPDIGADEVVQAQAGVVQAGSYYNALFAGGTLLAGNVTITNSLTLTGISGTGGNTVTLGCDATVSGAGTNSYIVGSVSKQFCATTMTPFVYPVGTTPDNMLANGIPVATEYSPFTANVTALGTVPSSLTVSVTDAIFPNGMDPMQSASRYWNVTETGDLTADITFTWLLSDVVGAEGMFNILRRDSNSMTTVYAGGTVDAMTHTGTAPGVSNFSQWGAGLLIPTAANASIEGYVRTAEGQGIRNATVIITGGGLSEPRYVQTGQLGVFRFEDLPVGETYIVSVVSKRFVFANPSRIIVLKDSVTGFDFEAIP